MLCLPISKKSCKRGVIMQEAHKLSCLRTLAIVAGCLLLSSRVFSVAKVQQACCQPEELHVSTDDLQASVCEEQSFCGQEAFKCPLIGKVVCSFIR